MLKKADGPSNAHNISQPPWLRQQVYNLSHLHKASKDPVDELLKYAKEIKEKIPVICSVIH